MRKQPNHHVPSIERLESRLQPSADPVMYWNNVALGLSGVDHSGAFTPDQGGPTRSARALAMVHLAIYDAVNAIDRGYTGYLTDMVAKPNTSMPAAVAAAAHDTLTGLFLKQKQAIDKAFADEQATFAVQGSAAAITKNQQAIANGLALGSYVAARMLSTRQNDGANAVSNYVPGTDPGDWNPDPLHPTQQALTPQWGGVTPFAMTDVTKFRAAAPPAINSPEFAASYQELIRFGGDGVITPTERTAHQTETGIFWGYDGQPKLGTPPNLYNQIAQTLAKQNGHSVVQNARFFALINMAMADAGVASWETKYVFDLWRPVTAIRAGDSDTNPDTTGIANWTPLGAPADNGNGTNFTPPFPAYTSGHATFGSALFRIMANYYRRDDITFTIGSDEYNGKTTDQNGNVRPVVFRTYTSFSQAAEENGQSRVYLGIHWSFDKTEGIKQGSAIADYISANFFKSRITSNQRFVMQTYQDILKREVDSMGLASWSTVLDQGTSRSDVVLGIQQSLEHRQRVVRDVYAKLLDRQPDPSGLDHFAAMLANGSTTEQVEAVIMDSGEYFDRRGGGTVTGFLAAVYQDALTREIDAGGQATFSQSMAQGAKRGEVAMALFSSDECRESRVEKLYETYLHRSSDVAGFQNWMSMMKQGASDGEMTVGFVGSEEYIWRLGPE